jgi:3-phenylpropionate/cinnamic acid dioxygenase small subunit
MSAELAVMRTVADLGLLVDARDWDGLLALFADDVAVDYTSLNGGEPATMPAADLIGGWRKQLEPLAATQHLMGNLSVTVQHDSATCAANVTATHVRTNSSGGPHWTVGGRYDLELSRSPGSEDWRIAALTLTVRWASGNQAIMG